MKTDYKFWYIKRDDDGFITEVAVRFYQGEYQTIDNKEVYVRTKKLETFNDLEHLATEGIVKGVVESNEKKYVLYNQNHFGLIKTDDELIDFCNQKISKDKGREVIKEQKI